MDNVTHGTASVKLRLIIEGILLEDVVSVQIKASVSAPVVATVVIPNVDAASRLLPGTFIQISYSLDGGQAYYHLFSGELQGFQEVEQSSSTQVALLFADVTIYWDKAKQYFARDDELFPSEISRIAAFMGTDKSEYMPIIESAGWNLVKAFRREPASLPGIRGLLGGIIHVLERIGGVYKGPKKFAGLNAYFAQAELRLRLTQRVWASQLDDTSIKMFRHHSFRKWIKRIVQSSNGLASFRDVINKALTLIFHNYSPVVAPYLAKGGRTIHIPGKPPSPGRSADIPESVKVFIRRRLKALDDFANILYQVDDLKRVHEGLTEKIIKSINTAKNASDVYIRSVREDARPQVIDPLIESLLELKLSSVSSNVFGSTLKLAGKRFPNEGALADEVTAAGIAKRTFKKLGERGISDEDYANAPPEVRERLDMLSQVQGYDIVVKYFNDLQAKLVEADNRYRSVLGTKKGFAGRAPRDIKTVDRLVETIFMPDILFAAPPLCNVIFPDERSRTTLNRNFSQEITRLRLTTKESWGALDDFIAADPLGMRKKVAVAPNLSDVHGEKTLSDAKRGARILLPHEVFTGINPAFEKLPYLNAFVGNDDDEIGYLQRTAEFLYIQGRMHGRVSSVVSRVFLPRLVCGMPVLVVGTRNATRHKIGVIKSLVHNISVSGNGDASTSITLTEARYHDETYDGPEVKKVRIVRSPTYGNGLPGRILQTASDLLKKIGPLIDYFHNLTAIIEQRPDFTGVESYRWEVEAASTQARDAHQRFSVDLVGLRGENNKAERELAAVYLSKLKDASTELLTARARAAVAGTNLRRDVPKAGRDASSEREREVKVERAVKNYTNEIADKLILAAGILKDLTGKQKNYRVKRTLIESSRPLEDFLRPSWASEIYERDRIGDDFYKHCLGVGSIIDAYSGKDIRESVEELVADYRAAVDNHMEWEFIDGLTARPIATEQEVARFNSNAWWEPDYAAMLDPPVSSSYERPAFPGGMSLPSGTKDTDAYDPATDPREARYKVVRQLADQLKKGTAE